MLVPPRASPHLWRGPTTLQSQETVLEEPAGLVPESSPGLPASEFTGQTAALLFPVAFQLTPQSRHLCEVSRAPLSQGTVSAGCARLTSVGSDCSQARLPVLQAERLPGRRGRVLRVPAEAHSGRALYEVVLHVLIHLISASGGYVLLFLPFHRWRTKPQRGGVTCPDSHGYCVVEPGCDSGSRNSMTELAPPILKTISNNWAH